MKTSPFISTEFAPFSLNCNILHDAKSGLISYICRTCSPGLFFLKKTRLLKNGEASVCMRITVNGTRVENNIRNGPCADYGPPRQELQEISD